MLQGIGIMPLQLLNLGVLVPRMFYRLFITGDLLVPKLAEPSVDLFEDGLRALAASTSPERKRGVDGVDVEEAGCESHVQSPRLDVAHYVS